MRGVITTSPQRRYYGTVLVLLLATTIAAGLLALVGTIKPAKAAFPGSNGKVVFTSIRSIDANDPSSTDEEIFTMNSDGSEQTNRTNDPLTDFSPDWQPV